MSLSVDITHRVGDFILRAEVEAPPGLTVLFGPSGSGKTTLVRAVAGVLRPDAGRIAVNGRALQDSARGVWLPPHKRRVGYVFQEGRLFPHLTVRRNLAYGRWFAKGRPGAAEADVVEMLGIGPLLDRMPATLSGGEQQRVAIGRALLAAPDLILADEPLAALDEPRKEEILPYFERLRDAADVPILYVSHAATEVARLATTVVVLQDGRVVRQGPAMDVLSDPSVAPMGVRAVGAILQARVKAHHEDGLTELDAGGERLFLPQMRYPAGTPVRVRIAAQEVMLSRTEPKGLSALNILPGTVEGIQTGTGPGAIVSVRTRAGIVLARITRRSANALGLAEGVACYAVVKSVSVAPGDVSGAAP